MDNHARELETSYNQLQGLIRQARALKEYENSFELITSAFLDIGLVHLKHEITTYWSAIPASCRVQMRSVMTKPKSSG
jgi:phage terminase Nu1 subunit (DNA packaging protein)